MFKGTAIALVSFWEFAIFLAAADCKLLYPLIIFPLTMHLNYSGDDPAGICNVESNQMDPLFPPVHLCPTGYCFLHFYRYLQ